MAHQIVMKSANILKALRVVRDMRSIAYQTVDLLSKGLNSNANSLKERLQGKYELLQEVLPTHSAIAGWGNLARHLSFGEDHDFRDIAYSDLPLIEDSLFELILDKTKEQPSISITRCFKTGTAGCAKNPAVNAKQIFVGMPFKGFDDSFEYAVKPAVEAIGMQCWKADQIISNIDIMCKICAGMQESKFAVINISGWNPNVLFELGLAYGLSRHVLIVKDKTTDTPADLRGMEYIEYENTSDLQRKLKKALSQLQLS